MRHYFDAEVAAKIGLHEALILDHIAFWIEKNYQRGQEPREGRYWMYESVAKMAEAFPYLTGRQVRSALQSLLDQKIIICANFNKQVRDRTKWYSITQEGFSLLAENG